MHQTKDSDFRDQQIWLAVASVVVIAAVALGAALIYTRLVMVPVVLAIFITVAVAPIVDVQIARWNFPAWLAVLTTTVFVLALLGLLGLILVLSVQAVIRIAAEYSDQVSELVKGVSEKLRQNDIQIDAARITNELRGRLPGIITQTAGTATSILSNVLLVTLFVFFLLLGRKPRHRHRSIYTEIENSIRCYINTLTLLSAVTALLIGAVLWLLGLRMAWLFAFLAFALNFIPNIGPIIATLLPVPVAVAQFKDVWIVLAVVAIPGVIHMVVGNVIAPRVMGRGLDLHPVTVLLSMAIWGLLWGVVGMVLAAPIMASVRIVLSRFSVTRSIAESLAGRLPGMETSTGGNC